MDPQVGRAPALPSLGYRVDGTRGSFPLMAGPISCNERAVNSADVFPGSPSAALRKRRRTPSRNETKYLLLENQAVVRHNG